MRFFLQDGDVKRLTLRFLGTWDTDLFTCFVSLTDDFLRGERISLSIKFADPLIDFLVRVPRAILILSIISVLAGPVFRFGRSYRGGGGFWDMGVQII